MLIHIFSQRLRELRDSMNETQYQLAQKIGTSRSTIAGYETARKSPDIYTLVRIADHFNVTVDYLLGRSYYRVRQKKTDAIMDMLQQRNLENL